MSNKYEQRGKMIRCKRDDNFVFLKYLGEKDLDGGFSRYDNFEKLPEDWLYENEFGYLCPECAREFKTFMTNFFNGEVAPCWKITEGDNNEQKSTGEI